MKKTKAWLLFALALTFMLALSSCTMLFPTANTCTVHRDINKDSVCDVCGAAIPVTCTNHVDADHDGKCDTTGCGQAVKITHVDEDHDGECDECEETGLKVKHVDKDKNKKCDVCDIRMPNACDCIDEDGDGYCDICEEEFIPCEHTDENEDGECDDCGAEIEEPCDEHIDENGDEKCDKCGETVETVECECEDTNFDGKCDKCEEPIDGVIALYENGVMNFNFVLAQGSKGAHVQVIDKLIAELEKLNLIAFQVEDKASAATEYEVIFNVSSTRGEQYQIDPHVYGPEGYAVQIVGTKILVVSGSEDSFADAVNAFKESFLGITSDTRTLTTRYVSEAQNVIEIQDDYKVSTITLHGEDIRGYTIAVDKGNETTFTAAKQLQNTLYTKSGYWLDIVPLEEADKSIVIAMAPKDPESHGYYATFEEGRIEFISEYPTVVQSKITAFFAAQYANAEGTLAFDSANNYSEDVRYVYYKDYGAVGDGRTDDSEAIRDAHEYANAGGHKVIATAGARYYIGKLEQTISIKTDTDWLDASFILDDKIISPSDKSPSGNYYRSTAIFTIDGAPSASYPEFKAKLNEINAAGGIKASTFTDFDFNFGQRLLVRVYNSNHKNYIRYGVNENAGATQQEVVLVDETGKIDPTTPFMFDFEKVTSVACYPIDDEPITIEGGKFYTSPWLQQTETSYTSYGRGIKCSRSNVTFKNIKHYIENEGNYSQSDHRYKGSSVDYGCPYGGFYVTNLCNNVRYYNCMASSHITYWQTKGAGMGTYDVDPGDATNVVYEECYQEDRTFFEESGQSRWGVMGSSGCKNVTFLNSKLSRFDAHNGVHNVNIIGSTIKMIRVDGTGTFRMENSIHYTKSFFGLREDYGGFWHGNVILKNNKVFASANTIDMFNNTWYNHYFGYPTAYPTNIIIDGLEIYNSTGTALREDPVVNIFSSGILSGATNIMKDYLPVKDSDGLETYYPDGTPIVVANKNQTPPPERVIIRNCEGMTWVIPTAENYPWLANTLFSVNEETECTQHFDLTHDGKCDDCGADFTPCTEHVDRNNDGRCGFCFTDVPIRCDKHIDKDMNAKCDICHAEYVCPGHLDEDSNRICDVCGGVLGCKDAHGEADANGNCKICKKLIPTCEACVDEAPHDNTCDVCNAHIVTLAEPCEHIDEAGDGICDLCEEEMPSTQ